MKALPGARPSTSAQVPGLIYDALHASPTSLSAHRADYVKLAKVWDHLIGLTKSAALDVATQGIRVNAVCPGCIDTPMGDSIDPAAMKEFLKDQPIGRMGALKRSPRQSFGCAVPAQAWCSASHYPSTAGLWATELGIQAVAGDAPRESDDADAKT